MSIKIGHPYHLVDPSPWPLFSSIAALGMATGLIEIFYFKVYFLIRLRSILLTSILIQWWRDVSREGTYQGLHTLIVETGLRWGIVLFITSEVMLFFSFFWAFFHSRLAPNIELGGQWPPIGIVRFNPFRVPLINTIILLSSGVRVTWSHHALMCGNYSQSIKSLIITVILGAYFTLILLIEYAEASFTLADGRYGSTFFIATGFHGLHVLIGTIFLLVIYFRIKNCMFRMTHHFGFEAAAWYWHFVDVVWLFLFVTIYWWGGA